MKKTLIALSVLVAAGSVNAANVYDNDGVMVDIYGDFAVHYEQAQGDDQNAKINVDDADFGFNFESAINEEMAIIANMDVTGEGDLALDDLTVGFKAAGTTVKVGKQVNLVDDFGLSNDYAFGLSTAEDSIKLAASGDQVIRVDYDSGEAFYAAFTTTAEEDGDGHDNDTDDNGVDDTFESNEGSQYSLMAGARFGDADVSATYTDGDVDSDATFIGLKGAYSLGDVVLSAVYTTAENNDTDAEVTTYGANIKYSMDKVGFNFGAVSADLNTEAEAADLAYGEDYVEYYANVSYAVAKNATAFFEVQDSDADNSDMGYAAGLTVSF
jgi:predicted porin